MCLIVFMLHYQGHDINFFCNRNENVLFFLFNCKPMQKKKKPRQIFGVWATTLDIYLIEKHIIDRKDLSHWNVQRNKKQQLYTNICLDNLSYILNKLPFMF